MDEAKAEQLGWTPIKGHLDRIAAVKTTSEFAKLAGELSNVGVGGLSGEQIEPDAKDPTANIIYFSQAGISLPEREYYLSKEARYADIRAKYVDSLTKFFTMVGRSNPAADAKAVLALETQMATIRWTPAESRDAIKTYNKVALAKFDTDFAGFDWMAWVRAQGYDKLPDVIVAQPSYFKGIGALSKKVPLETWKAWLTAKVITPSEVPEQGVRRHRLRVLRQDALRAAGAAAAVEARRHARQWLAGRGGREDATSTSTSRRSRRRGCRSSSPTCSRRTGSRSRTSTG